MKLSVVDETIFALVDFDKKQSTTNQMVENQTLAPNKSCLSIFCGISTIF